jgi:hypothetical protein
MLVGELVGLVDGGLLGSVGLCVPGKVPLPDGAAEGEVDGLVDGDLLGCFEGDNDGDMLRLFDGELVGLVEGDLIGTVGFRVSGEVPLLDGEAEGCEDGLVGEG